MILLFSTFWFNKICKIVKSHPFLGWENKQRKHWLVVPWHFRKKKRNYKYFYNSILVNITFGIFKYVIPKLYIFFIVSLIKNVVFNEDWVIAVCTNITLNIPEYLLNRNYQGPTLAAQGLLWQHRAYFDSTGPTLTAQGLLWQHRTYFDSPGPTLAAQGIIWPPA